MPKKIKKEELEENEEEVDEAEQVDNESESRKPSPKRRRSRVQAKENEDQAKWEQMLADKDKEIAKHSQQLAKIKEAFGIKDEKPDEKVNNLNELKDLIKAEISKVHERLDEREHEDTMEGLSQHFGLQTEDQRDMLELKLAKAQDRKGEELTQKEVDKIGKSVAKMFNVKPEKQDTGKKAPKLPDVTATQDSTLRYEETDDPEEEDPNTGYSSVIDTNPSPAANLNNSDTVTLKQFNNMDIMEKSELWKTNRVLYDKLKNVSLEKQMNLHKQK